jgi:phage terminase large subunit-like protein
MPEIQQEQQKIVADGHEYTVAELLESVDRRASIQKMFLFKPYPWQMQFYEAGNFYNQRMVQAGNRVGKTMGAAFEVALHATQNYPPWWRGRKFDKGIKAWCGSVTNELLRDSVQRELLGRPGAQGTGMIPARNIIDVKYRQAGVSEVVDRIFVETKNKKVSEIGLKTYEQGWRKFQATTQDLVWLDEEPEDFKIFTECMTRIMTVNGLMVVTYTPLLGITPLVEHFDQDFCWKIMVGWGDSEHLSENEEMQKQLLDTYMEHERDARQHGIPVQGEGRVWPVAEGEYVCDPFEIPKFYARIAGMDFGSDHPTAAIWMAWDRDTDTIYIYDEYAQRRETPAYHAEAIKRRGKWIPVAWPHDGANIDARSAGTNLKGMYMEQDVLMLQDSARYENDKGGPQPTEPIVMEVLERMQTGRIKVFSNCQGLLKEMRNYHRKDGKLVRKNDDRISAMFYALMMKRFAKQDLPVKAQRRVEPMFQVFA